MAQTAVAPQMTSPPTPYYVANPDDDQEQQKRLQAALMASGGNGTPATQQAADALPPTPAAPTATLAPAQMADQPAASSVTAAQTALAQQQKIANRERLATALVGVGGAVAGGLAHTWGGQHIQDAEEQARSQQETQIASDRQPLVEQLKSAQAAQTGQYEADQRRREAVEQAQTLAGSRLGSAELGLQRGIGVADINAASRPLVAQIGANARTAAATTAAGARTGAATIAAGASGARDTANVKIGQGHDAARVTTGEYAADAAQGRQNQRFEHQDNKPTAAEDQRADYGHQLIQLSNDIDEIVSRRPNLVGPMAGRVTTLRGLIGTDDPDIARLNTLHHQLGIISMATHGMRNGQTLEAGANSILNGLKNGPEALHAATDQARKSAQTFTEAPIRPGATAAAPAGTLGLPVASLRQQVSGPATIDTSRGPVSAIDPQGNRVTIPKGAKVPPGYKPAPAAQ